MAAIQVKNVPEDLHDELRRRAADEGISINDFVLRMLRVELSMPTTHEWLSELAAAAPRASVPDSIAALDDARSEREADLGAATAVPHSTRSRVRTKRRTT